MKVTVVLPARMASHRLPQKMLLSETGKPLIQHTYERIQQAEGVDRILIATDHERIFAAAKAFGAEVVMTDPNHPSGTDRLAEVAKRFLSSQNEMLVNVQGDEPEIEPAYITQLVQLFKCAERPMATLACAFSKDKLSGPGTPEDPNCVKVVMGNPILSAAGQRVGHDALYFSRSMIPYPRETTPKFDPTHYFMHLGIYAYSPEFLEQFVALPQGTLEQIEKLEQLRALENGFGIAVGTVKHATPGIDSQADYEAFVARYQQKETTTA